MLLKICDIVNTFCQSFLIVWVCNNISSKENKLSKLKSYILMTLIFSEVVILTYSIEDHVLKNFYIVLIMLLLIILFYSKSLLDAFVGFGVSYSIIAFSAYFIVTFYQNVLAKLNLSISAEVQIFLFIYVPIGLTYLLVYKYKKYIFNAVISLKRLKHSLIFILVIDYGLIFLDTVRLSWTTHDMGLVFKSTLYLTTFLAFVFVTVYYAKINDKSKEVELLNAALNEKITELKKVKHDYGSEISGLYGLYQLGKMDRVGAMLKSIVDRNQTLNTSVNVTVNATDLVASVLQPACSKGIDLIVFDSGEYENLVIKDNDLLKLLSNIVKNSIDVLESVENPIIKFNSYNSYEGITITIENNGPEIPEEIRNKIFKAGFSTKVNKNSDRGYGLSIVSDIIEKCNGKISVKSNKKWTEFKIEIPYKVS